MSETDLQIGGGYVYQWECALLLALNHFFEPVRYDPTLFDLIQGFLGEVAEMQLEGENRQNGLELEDINLINGDRRILIQVKTKQAEGERWTPTDSLLLKALYRFYASRAFAEEPDKGRFVFLTNRPFSPDLVRVKSAIQKGTVRQCDQATTLCQHLARYAQNEKKAPVDASRFYEVLGRTALVEYLSVDAVKANVQAKLQAYGRTDWKEAHALLLEYFMRQSTHVGGGRVTRESVAEVLGPPGSHISNYHDRTITTVSVFVATPSDVQDERDRIHRVIDELNEPGALAEQYNCTLKMLDWRSAVPGMGRPEHVILEQLAVESCDIFIGVLWHRFGTPSGGRDPNTDRSYSSGTEEEFKLAYHAWQERGQPRILFYRRTTAPISLDDIDPEQLGRVQAFWQAFGTSGEHPGLFQAYGTPDDLERRVRNDLIKLLPRLT